MKLDPTVKKVLDIAEVVIKAIKSAEEKPRKEKK